MYGIKTRSEITFEITIIYLAQDTRVYLEPKKQIGRAINKEISIPVAKQSKTILFYDPPENYLEKNPNDLNFQSCH